VSVCRALLGIGLVLLLVGAPAGRAAPERAQRAGLEVARTFSLAGTHPLALAVYEGGDKLFVADDDGGNLLVLDGATGARLGSVAVGGAVFHLAVDESQGKVYAASDVSCCTTGITPGTGLISVVDARTHAVRARINPGRQGNLSAFVLVGDEPRDRVYVSFYSGIGVIDAATDTYRTIHATDDIYDAAAIDTRRNKVYFVHYRDNRIVVVDGATFAIDVIDLGRTGARGPLDIAMNDVENQLYLTMLHVPGQAEMAVLTLDLDTGAGRFAGRDDLEPLVFNSSTNRLFAGVQVGERGAIIEGRTGELTPIALGDAGFGAGAVRESTDNAYFASQTQTFAVSGGGRCSEGVSARVEERGGLVASSVAINQRTGRVFVSNDDEAGRIMVIQDAPLRCASRRCVVPSVRGRSLASARSAIVRAGCSVGTVRRTHSTAVRSGRVISQRPRAGARLAARAKIDLVVSKGPRR
jgi:DNA-binding beta-propeller fold protein YncE